MTIWNFLVAAASLDSQFGIWFAVSLLRSARQKLHSPDRFQRAICVAALLGLTGCAVHSLVDFGLHLLVIAFVFLVLVMLATTKLEIEG